MSRLVFLLEERSMKAFLEGFLPRQFPGLSFLCLSHEGKSDLEKSIPRKIKAWREPGVRFVVVRDNDGSPCLRVKKKLRDLCIQYGRPDTLIRIACQEIEAWYLGEPKALAAAFGRPELSRLSDKARFRDPDSIQKPSLEIRKIIPEFQKISGARRMGALLTETETRSRSFLNFIQGLRRIAR